MSIIVGNTLIRRAEDDDTAPRLAQVFSSTKEELASIALAAVGAKNDSVPDDPINAPGQLGYIYGTRAVRVVFRAKGWLIDRRDNIESTVQPDTRVRIIYQNTDTAGRLFPSPKAISDKGVAAERLIDLAEPFLFPDMEEERKAKIAEAKKKENETVWFLCVASDESGIWAEISRPRYIKNNQFGEFIERIFLIEGILPPATPLRRDDPDQEYDIRVSRK
ncbi:MAG TPA: hypothetical protein VFI23_06600 [Rhizomicrobium sp.]|nr:hypothetical protein [Rhizomicrobium sp.]